MLQKLTIISFATDKFVQGGLPTGLYSAMFNPEAFDVDYNIEYDRTPVLDAKNTTNRSSHKPGRKYSFDFLLDDTGAAGVQRNIPADILHFRQVVGHGPSSSGTSYLTLIWGTFLADCVIDNFKVSYELFDQSGLPIRARISAHFSEHLSAEANWLEGQLGDLLGGPAGAVFNVGMSALNLLNAAGASGSISLR